MFEENYRREMQAALPSAAATDALERRMDALRRRPKRPPVREVAVVLLALLLLAVPLLPALLQPQTQGYEALLSKLEGMSGYRALSPNDFLFSSDSVMEVEPPASEEPSDGAESGNAAYSETNNQVAGVQEPDTVKTDGRFLYSLSAGENVLHITRADNGVLSAAASIDPVGRFGCRRRNPQTASEIRRRDGGTARRFVFPLYGVPARREPSDAAADRSRAMVSFPAARPAGLRLLQHTRTLDAGDGVRRRRPDRARARQRIPAQRQLRHGAADRRAGICDDRRAGGAQ